MPEDGVPDEGRPRPLTTAPPRPRRWWTLLWRLLTLAALLYALHLGSGLLLHWFAVERLGPGTAAMATLAYAGALAIPFVPGVEIGLGLMAMFGAQGAMLVYLGTLLGLSLAFLAGTRIPMTAFVRLALWLRLHRLARSLQRFPEGDSGDAALTQLNALAPRRLAAFCLRHRYLLLILIINLPGNALIGGGGGIALLAGLSRRFRYPPFLLACAVAVAPVPLLFLIRG